MDHFVDLVGTAKAFELTQLALVETAYNESMALKERVEQRNNESLPHVFVWD
jgi:hypothetical protein